MFIRITIQTYMMITTKIQFVDMHFKKSRMKVFIKLSILTRIALINGSNSLVINDVDFFKSCNHISRVED